MDKRGFSRLRPEVLSAKTDVVIPAVAFMPGSSSADWTASIRCSTDAVRRMTGESDQPERNPTTMKTSMLAPIRT